MKERPSKEELHQQALNDSFGLDLPESLDLRDKNSVVDFLSKTISHLSKRIPGYENLVVLLVGSTARGNASNNSDIDIMPIYPMDRGLAASRRRFEYALSLIIEKGYDIGIDGFQNSLNEYHLTRQGWQQSLIDDYTVVICSNAEIKKQVEENLKIGKRGISKREGPIKHTYDPTVPAKEFRGIK